MVSVAYVSVIIIYHLSKLLCVACVMPFQYLKQYWLPISRLVQTSMKRESQWEYFLFTKYVKFIQSLLILLIALERCAPCITHPSKTHDAEHCRHIRQMVRRGSYVNSNKTRNNDHGGYFNLESKGGKLKFIANHSIPHPQL